MIAKPILATSKRDSLFIEDIHSLSRTFAAQFQQLGVEYRYKPRPAPSVSNIAEVDLHKHNMDGPLGSVWRWLRLEGGIAGVVIGWIRQ